MSFSSDNSSRESIQAIQFELWPDCNNHCTFCYLNGTQRTTSLEQKRANILDAQKVLSDYSLYNIYNAVGLIGGEFFQDQLKGLDNEWNSLICYLEHLLRMHTIKEVWIASSLMQINEGYHLYSTLSKFDTSQYNEDQRVILCTSYDTIGRFYIDFSEATPEERAEAEAAGLHQGDFDQEAADEWLDNVRNIRENYPNIVVHVQIILTQDVIDKLIENPNYFDFITDLGCIIDFRYPSITRADCPTATVIEDYRSLLLARHQNFPENFFIESRANFLRFLKVFSDKYGLEKVRNLVHQPEMRSRRLKIYVDNAEIEDRWNDDRNVYLECGHVIDGLCYIDSDKCIYCDIEKFIENQENS